MYGLLRPETKRVSDVVEGIVKGEFVLPRFQRDFVWSQTQVVELLNSIYEQIPIGVFLLWDSDQLGKAYKFIGDTKPEGGPHISRHPLYVLDGQQRLTSLLFSLKPDGLSFSEEIDAKYNIYFSLDSESFYTKCPNGEKCMPAQILGDKDKYRQFYVDFTKKKDGNKYKEALKRIDDFLDYEIPILIFSESVTLDVVAKTFQYLNAKGTPLTLMNLIAAKTYSPGKLDLYENIDGTRNVIDEGGVDYYGDFTGEEIIRSIAIFNNIDNNPTTIVKKLSTGHIVRDYKKAEDAFLEALVFVSDDMGIPVKLMPYPPMLIPLIVFFMNKPRETLDPEHLNHLRQWFWRSSFNNRYGSEAASTGVKDSRILVRHHDLNKEVGLKRPEFTAQDFIEAQINSAHGKAVLGLLQAQKPLDLYSNIDINMRGIRKRKRKVKNIDKHHIFPKDYLKSKLRSRNRELANSVCNICWVSKNTNLLISNSPPSRYFKKLKEVNENFTETAKYQFISVATSSPIWTNNYRKFLKLRAELIYKEALKLSGFR